MTSNNAAKSTVSLSDAELYDWIIHERHVRKDDVKKCLAFAREEKISLAQALTRKGVLPQEQIDRISRGYQAARALNIPGYKIIGLLGAGAMAMVFKAKQTALDRIVAIKILPQKLSQNAEYLRMFKTEGRAAAKLNHPNIVQAIDVLEANGRYFFVMEYVEGHTLFDELEGGRVFKEAEALDVVLQVAEALEHAHNHGIIHRDVKPRNIMITDEGVCKLADMGLARLTQDQQGILAEKGRSIGTPYYMSPEQIVGGQVDFRVDIYGLGGTLYHLVTGRMPFPGKTEREIMEKHLREALVPPDHIRPELSNGLGEVVELMMAKVPNDRYGSVADLLVDLRAIRRGKPPILAREKLSQASLEHLAAAEGGPMFPEQPADTVAAKPAKRSSTVAVILLVILLTLSVLLNAYFIIFYSS
ncbi:MAG: serine/threonine protein kinase [Phycisphaerae bacterium]|nr:serine/threonine protein kinase [Phycisphaerae bacterium]